MFTLNRRLVVGLALVVAATFVADASLSAQSGRQAPTRKLTTAADRQAAAERAAAARLSANPNIQGDVGADALGLTAIPGCPAPVLRPLGVPDYMSGCIPNWANTQVPLPDPANPGKYIGGIRKFVDTLPGLGVAAKNNLGQYMPVAVPDTTTYPGSDYYEINLVEYTQQLHSDLAPTKLRGYVQVNTSDPTVSIPSYLGPVISATSNRPVRIKFTNKLAVGAAGNLFIPTDTTMMGAGRGPAGTNYTQNRATLHLHGGATPWISDGTPHQWTTPAGESTAYPKGVSVSDVPDMPVTGPGELTFFYSNQQSARLMFYHDHAYGLTRLNVYAGEAAGYLLSDATEAALVSGGTVNGVAVAAGTIPADQIPLIIQDKTFVPSAAQLTRQDPTWDTANWGGAGSLWFPHVYMPNQNPADLSGANAMGRWDYGPWFWPPMDPSTLVVGEVACPTVAVPTQKCPGTPNPSLTPEAFLDTPLVNGTAYPTTTVAPKPYRLRILNASNDRMLNLQLYTADPTVVTPDGRLNTEVRMVSAAPTVGYPATWPTDGRAGGVPDPLASGPTMIQIGTEGGFLPAPVAIPPQPVGYNYNRRDIVVLNIQDHALLIGPAERADVIVDFTPFAGKTLILYNDAPAPVPAFDTRTDYYTGDPDQTTTGGAPTTIAGYGPNTRTIMQIQVSGTASTTTFLGPGNGGPTTGVLSASQTSLTYNGVAYTVVNGMVTLPDCSLYIAAANGVMIPAGIATPCTPVAGTVPVPATPSAALTAALAAAFTASQPPIIVPIGTYSRIQDTSITFVPPAGGAATANPMQPKAIQELFELDYGRMNATLGVELPFTNFNTQTTIPLGYKDQATELISNGAFQLWKITHNGVDSHVIHFHLFNVQVVNRVGWDGAIRPPDDNELGWKESVRMNPLEDAIVAFLPVAPQLVFGVPNSSRVLDPTAATGSNLTLTNPADGNAITVVNALTNFGWEYVWHCHILGHEENDMMRPIVFTVASTVPQAPTTLTMTAVAPPTLTWTDPTPVATPSTLGNPRNEIGFRIERRLGAGAWGTAGFALANATTFTDAAALVAGSSYSYRVIAYNAAGDSTASNVVTFTSAAKLLPVITWANPASIVYGTALSGTQLNATANTAGTFVYTPPAGTVLNAGAGQTLSVTFTPTDTVNYSTATKTVTITVTKATPVITWANPANIPVGTALSATQLNATANFGGSAVPGAFVYTPALGTVLTTGCKTLSVTFTPTAPGNYNTVSKTVSINVTFTGPAAGGPASGAINGAQTVLTYSGATYNIVNGLVTFPDCTVYIVASNGALIANGVAAGCTSAVCAGTTPTTPTITWATPNPIVVGSALTATQLNATSNRAGTFVYSPPLGTVMNTLGNQTLLAVFTPTNTALYTTATKTVTLLVTNAFIGPLNGGPRTGTISGTTLTYNGATYTIVNGRVTFPNCEVYIVLNNGFLIYSGVAPNCVPADARIR